MSQSALAALRRRVTCRLTKGIDTVFELEAALLEATVETWGERTVSGEKIRGLGGCLRALDEGAGESDMGGSGGRLRL